MNIVHVLDCTLRDGGYCNQWQFGRKNIRAIVGGLCKAGVQIVECGFLTNRVDYNPDVTKFTDLQQVEPFLPAGRGDKMFVVMLNHGEYDIEKLPDCAETPVDGIRLAFHKKNRVEALEACRRMKEKGYKVFVQAMVSLSYTDEEFLDTIRRVNAIGPYAFYIVDSFGMMKQRDLTRLFYMVEHNLKADILIGFHSHNNMQLAYSNAQTLAGLRTNRDLIIDASVFGMGRGAGNLNTELFVEYLNENHGGQYQLPPLLNLIDEILSGFHERNYWGYSLPNYISAIHNAHPNYAGYLDDKHTLTVEDMNRLFSMMDEEKKVSYDKAYMEELYLRYMEEGRAHTKHMEKLRAALAERSVLLVAPGKSVAEQLPLIRDFIAAQSPITISVNFVPAGISPDFIFVSNLRRFRGIDPENYGRCIATSNIPASGVYLQPKYADLLSELEAVRDNAGLMAVKLMLMLGVKQVYLAGFDGFSHESEENYADGTMAQISRNSLLDAMNAGMQQALRALARETAISFLTTPRHITL